MLTPYFSMKIKFPHPSEGSVFYEDARLYACLATESITRGHVVIVWKKSVTDLHLLKKNEYEYLMDIVDVVRNALLKILKIKKVYLIYMDEANQVHWHLVPRYNEKGFNIFHHHPKKLRDFSLVPQLRKKLQSSRV